jgi:uncharacterized protein (TIGR02246 family)
MKTFKSLIISLLLILPFTSCFAQSETDKVKQALTKYKQALEGLDVSGTDVLFTANSQIIESGKVEGTYQDYLANHIGPELGHFKSFKFENYEVEVTVSGKYAFAVETYHYTIVLDKDDSEVKRKGAATSFLEKDNGQWKIKHMHNSSRKP